MDSVCKKLWVVSANISSYLTIYQLSLLNVFYCQLLLLLEEDWKTCFASHDVRIRNLLKTLIATEHFCRYNVRVFTRRVDAAVMSTVNVLEPFLFYFFCLLKLFDAEVFWTVARFC